MDPVKLLLIDDERGFLDTLAKRLGKRGFEPLTAGSGEAGLSLLSENEIPVVVLDVKMPGMNGLEVLSRIKNDFPQTEVILMTGHSSTLDGVSGIKAGAFDYLIKPVELEHLVKKITQAVDKQRRTLEKDNESKFRKQINRQLAATERLAALGTLATGIAHEINNPLAIIQESAGWMRALIEKPHTGFPRENDFKLVLGKIESAVERASRITHNLLGMVQRDAGSIQEIVATSLLDEILELAKPRADEKGVNLSARRNAFAIQFWSDPYRLRQILLNLLTNAIDATPAGGDVSLDASTVPDGVVFQVKDTGEGIAPESLEKIFEPFYTTKPAGKGTGLGLYISRRIAEKIGGKIQVDSRLNHGAVFRLSLPVCPLLNDDNQNEHYQGE